MYSLEKMSNAAIRSACASRFLGLAESWAWLARPADSARQKGSPVPYTW